MFKSGGGGGAESQISKCSIASFPQCLRKKTCKCLGPVAVQGCATEGLGNDILTSAIPVLQTCTSGYRFAYRY